MEGGRVGGRGEMERREEGGRDKATIFILIWCTTHCL